MTVTEELPKAEVPFPVADRQVDSAVPAQLDTEENSSVLTYLAGHSAHSDGALALLEAVEPLGAAEVFCPSPDHFRYVVVHTSGTIFGFAQGTSRVAFRLDPELRSKAIRSGGESVDAIGSGWVSFEMFRSEWPEPDLSFWARKAYATVRALYSV